MSSAAPKTTQRTPFKRWCDENTGLFFLIPWILGFLIFKAYPFASSLFYSFTDLNFFKGISQYGIMNYVEIFTSRKTLSVLLTTVKYAFITVPLKLVFALFIAYILNFKIKFVNLFRTVYYIPSILGGSVAIAVLWRALFKDTGVVNTILGFFGVQGPDWLADKTWALFVICLLRVWQFGSAMVLFLAALKGVPADLYEAATIDGASKTKQFFSITVPMITPVIFYNLVTQIAQAFQEFNGPYIITQGGPRNATTLVSLLVYNYAFKSNAEIFSGIGFLTANPTLQGYIDAVTQNYGGDISIWRAFINTYSFVIPKVIFTVISSVIAAYGFSRFKFKGRDMLFGIMISTLFLPQVVLNVPQYLMYNSFGWINSPFYLPLWVPTLFATETYFVYQLVQFMRSIPHDLDEAAAIDGCGPVKILYKIIAPMLSPSLVACGLFQFMWSCNDYMGPLLYVQTPSKYPMSIFVKLSMDADSGFNWNRILALSLISIIPQLVVFFCAQDAFIDGISAGAVKG